MGTIDQSRHASVPSSWADPTVLRQSEPLWRRAMPLLVWLGCLVAAVVLLLALGGGRLAAPALTEPSTWAGWAAARDPLEVTMVVLRVVALGLAWYLVGVTSISVLARVLRAARLVRLADALSVGPVKVLVQQAVGVGLAASVLATAVPGTTPAARTAATQASGPTVVMAPIDSASADAPAQAVGQAAALPVRLDATPSASDHESTVPIPVPAPQPQTTPAAPVPAVTSTPAVTTAPSSTPAPGATPVTPAPPAPEVAPDQTAVAPGPSTGPATATHDDRATDATDATDATSASREVRIRPGDHFWALAEQEVAAHLRRPGSEAEVVAHWQAIVEANADRLEVRGNPDLLLPGQLVVLPAVGEVLS